jgi:hypothetical protein
LSTINALFTAFAFAFRVFNAFAFFGDPDSESEPESDPELDDDDDDDDDERDDDDEEPDDDESPSTPNRIVNAFLREGFTTGFGLLEKKEVDGSSVETFSEIGLFANRAKNSFIVSNLIYLS